MQKICLTKVIAANAKPSLYIKKYELLKKLISMFLNRIYKKIFINQNWTSKLNKRIISIIAFIILLNCNLNTPAGKLFPPLFLIQDPRSSISLPTPDGFRPSPLTLEEKEGVKLSMNSLSADGFLSAEARKTQLEGLKATLEFLNTSELQESLQITGPIPGYTNGMTFRQYSDFALGQLASGLDQMPKSVLNEYRISVLVWVARLRLLSASCDSTTTEACDELNYLIEKYLVLREKIVEEIKKKTLAEVQ
ncbi:hypothetical protein A1343_15910 [Leptospira interrogans serovar Bataviae]|nr:hypothetical protein [Leptospira interrogans serovar Bataviae]OAM86128.1 hypothetical protein A1343_15910 [Leptospira interrogans serovar Bataviae]QOI40700.1 hypothetical protein Lepto1548_19710 [Leptospira interrogans serovar Bataviae]